MRAAAGGRHSAQPAAGRDGLSHRQEGLWWEVADENDNVGWVLNTKLARKLIGAAGGAQKPGNPVQIRHRRTLSFSAGGLHWFSGKDRAMNEDQPAGTRG
jgi:hypothetical protein